MIVRITDARVANRRARSGAAARSLRNHWQAGIGTDRPRSEPSRSVANCSMSSEHPPEQPERNHSQHDDGEDPLAITRALEQANHARLRAPHVAVRLVDATLDVVEQVILRRDGCGASQGEDGRERSGAMRRRLSARRKARSSVVAAVPAAVLAPAPKYTTQLDWLSRLLSTSDTCNRLGVRSLDRAASLAGWLAGGVKLGSRALRAPACQARLGFGGPCSSSCRGSG